MTDIHLTARLSLAEVFFDGLGGRFPCKAAGEAPAFLYAGNKIVHIFIKNTNPVLNGESAIQIYPL